MGQNPVWVELAKPFPYEANKWRVMNVSKGKDSASVAFYIDARDVMDRLDAVVGPENWSNSAVVLVGDREKWIVQCTLTVYGVSKTDVGEGDAAKDAFSDALKRAAVHWGVGRYLYDMDNGGYFAINEYKQFTKEATERIRALLDKNLRRIGMNVPVTAPGQNGGGSAGDGDDLLKFAESMGGVVVAPVQVPATTGRVVTSDPLAAPTDDSDVSAIAAGFKTPQDAQAWARGLGIDQSAALQKWLDVVKHIGSFSPKNRQECFAAYVESFSKQPA